MTVSSWNAGDPECTVGLSFRIYNNWINDADNGFSPNLSGIQKRIIRSQAYQWSKAIVDQFNADDVIAGGGGGGGGPTTALLVSFAPGGDLASTNVQEVILELRDDTDTKLLGYLKRDGTTAMTGNLNGGSHNAVNFANPIAAQDLATKAYVDAVAAGLDPKEAVLVATTTNITLSGSQTIDGVLITSGRVLVKNQTLQAQNGIYDSNSSGAWTRSPDADTNPEVRSGMFVFVQQGGQSGTGWVLIVPGGVTLGVTPLLFSQFSGPGSYTNGVGILLIGNQFSADFGSGAGKICQGNDPRLSDDRVATGLRTLTTIVSGTSSPAPTPGMFPIANSGTSFTWGFIARTKQSFTGLGPHSIPAALPDRAIFITPGTPAIANLPSIADPAVIDGWRIQFVNNGSTTDMVILFPNGTDTIASQPFYRIFQQGNVVMVADKTTNTWVIEVEHVGYPASIGVFVDNAGVDTNPGTAVLPVRTMRQAFLLLDVQWTDASPTVTVPAGYFSDESSSFFPIPVPSPKPGSLGQMVRINGPTPVDAGFGTITATGGVAAPATGLPPAQACTVTFASIPALANNAGCPYLIWGLTGSWVNKRFGIVKTTATSIEFLRLGTTFTTGTFQVRKPNAWVAGTFVAANGVNASLFITQMDLFEDGTEHQSGFVNLTLQIVLSRLFGGATDCTSTITACVVPFDNVGLNGGGFTHFGGTADWNTCGIQGGVFSAVRSFTGLGANVTMSLCGTDDSAGIGWGIAGMVGASTLSLGAAILRNTLGGFGVGKGAYFNFTNTAPSVNLTGSADFITVQDGGTARLVFLQGSVGSTRPQAVVLKTGARIDVDVNTTINAGAPSKAVAVGSAGVFAWSAAPITDLDQLCRVGTI